MTSSGRNVIEVNFNESSLSIGDFQAVDYFKDGSLYLLNAPGVSAYLDCILAVRAHIPCKHAPGHIIGLARVTPTSFILFGGDACHHVGQLRPTDHHHQHVPCPGELVAAARKSISTAAFPDSKQSVNASGNSGFDLTSRSAPFFDVAEGGAYTDPATSRVSAKKLSVLDANPDVLVVLAHDQSIVDLVDFYPAKLNDWKAKGWKTQATWKFVDEKDSSFRLAPV